MRACRLQSVANVCLNSVLLQANGSRYLQCKLHVLIIENIKSKPKEIAYFDKPRFGIQRCDSVVRIWIPDFHGLVFREEADSKTRHLHKCK